MAVAGLLHDVVEDQGYDLSQIRKSFGVRVAEMVAALSERKTDERGVKRAWETRKREGLDQLRGASPDVAAVKAADTLHNVCCIALDMRRDGPQVWDRFARGPEPQLRYYREALGAAREALGDHPLVAELADAVESLARLIHGDDVES